MYTVSISPRASRSLSRIPNPDHGRITAAIDNLANDPRPPGAKKLVGRAGWRIRVGNYRVIYTIDDEELTVTIVDVGTRGSIYN